MCGMNAFRNMLVLNLYNYSYVYKKQAFDHMFQSCQTNEKTTVCKSNS